jgi:hypothetical protein
MTGQIIPTKVHAMEDYLTSSTMPYAARKLGVTPTTRTIMDSVAAMAGMQSMVTDYEGGVVRLLPMRAHLASDMLLGAGLITVAALMRRLPSVDRLLLAGLGTVTLASAMLTQSHPSDRRGK